MVKKIMLVGLIIILLCFALVISKDVWMRSAIVVTARTMLGAPVGLDSFSLSFIKQSVHLKGLRIQNPPGFDQGTLIDIPEVTVAYDMGALLKHTMHLPLVVVNLKELVVEKNKDGKLNVDSLKVVEDQQKKAKEPQQQEKAQKPKQEEIPMQIDELKLSIGRVIMKEIGKDGKEKIQVFDVGIRDKTYKNITSAQQLSVLILSESMKPTAIKGAAVYGLATIAGVGFLPLGAAVVLTGKDKAEADFTSASDKVFDEVVTLLKSMGSISEQSKEKGMVKAKVSGSSVTIAISKKDARTTHIVITARKTMLPDLKTAEGILYGLSEKLK